MCRTDGGEMPESAESTAFAGQNDIGRSVAGRFQSSAPEESTEATERSTGTRQPRQWGWDRRIRQHAAERPRIATAKDGFLECSLSYTSRHALSSPAASRVRARTAGVASQ